MRPACATLSHPPDRRLCPAEFTNDAVFDDTSPAGDGVLEIGHRGPLEQLKAAMEDWFRRKGYLRADERLEVTEDRN
jgi:hypothetical protein